MMKHYNIKTLYIIFLLLVCIMVDLTAQRLDHVQGELLIQPNTQTDKTIFLRDLNTKFPTRDFKLEPISKAPLHVWLLQFDNNTINEYHLLDYLRKNPLLTTVQHNHFVRDRVVPNDPQFDNQWQYINTGQTGGTPNADLDAESAWAVTTGGLTTDGDSIVVCVIDEGLDLSHEDLQGNLWLNHAEIPDNGLDDDDNGYIDDYKGWNVVGLNDNLTNGNNAGWHGTPVAGIIAARGNNNIGVTGVNWNSKIMMVVRGATEAQTLAAYAYPYHQRKRYNESNGEEGAFVVATNTSWGVDFGQPDDAPLWCAFYDSLGTVGILDVAATVNGNFNVDLVGDLPTTCPSDYLVSVTNLNHNDSKEPNAGYGPTSIDLGAYGSSIWTLKKNNSYGAFSGTSAAAPHVAGAIALLYSSPCPDISWFAKNEPDATALLMKSYLMDGATPNTNIENLVLSGGRLNLNNSMQLLMDNCAFTACFPPSLISVNDIELETVSLDWLSSGNITSVNLSYRLLGAATWNEIDNISAPYTIQNLSPCETYEYRLKSICSTAMSPYSPINIFKTDGCCEAPTLFTIGNVNTNSAQLSWPDQTVAESYHFRYREVGGSWTEYTLGESNILLENLENCTSYEVQVSTLCTNGNSTPYSDLFEFQTAGCSYCLENDYCEIAPITVSLSWISHVNVSDLDNVSGNSSDGYTDFTDQSASLIQGYFHSISIGLDYEIVDADLFVQVWIDYNQDGQFEGSDLAVQSNTAVNSFIGNINIPADALLGNTRMRIIASTELSAPCETPVNAGEIEDYCVSILTPTECLPPVGYSLQPGINNITLSWIGSLLTDNYNLRYRNLGEIDWAYINTSLHYITIEGLTPCTDYELQVQSECAGENSVFSQTHYFTTLGCGACLDLGYCEPEPGSIPFEWIARFQLNDMDHYSAGEGYGNFSGEGTDLIQGQTYPFVIEPGFAGDPYDEYYTIWIDFNQDGTFEDISEKVYDIGTPTTSSIITGELTIPSYALQGSTRMRLTMKYFSAPDNACEGGFDGEIQDYCINIYNNPMQNCHAPSNIEQVFVTDSSAYFIWDGPTSTLSYQVRYKRYSDPLDDWHWVTGINDFLLMKDLLPCQLYEYQIRTVCDTGLSPFTDTDIFETACLVNSTEVSTHNNISVYPNPFENEIYVEWARAIQQATTLTLYNATGIEIYQHTVDQAFVNDRLQISMEHLASGIYLLQLRNKSGSEVHKLIKK